MREWERDAKAHAPRGGPTGTPGCVRCANISQSDTVIEPISMMVPSPQRLLRISCSDCLAVPSPHLPPPRRSLFGSAQQSQGSRRPRRRSLPTRDGGGSGRLEVEGAAALSPTPGAPPKEGGRRRGACWEMQSRPSERLNPTRQPPGLGDPFSPSPTGPAGPRGRNYCLIFQESQGIGPARANTGAHQARWF